MMDIKEKLRLASQQAENEQLSLIPPDSEIEWIPSKEFTKKMSDILVVQPKKRTFIIRRIVSVAAVAALIATICIPVFMNISETTDGANGDIYIGTEPQKSESTHLPDGSGEDCLCSYPSEESDSSSNSNSQTESSEPCTESDTTDESESGTNGDNSPSTPNPDDYDDRSDSEDIPVEILFEPDYLPDGYVQTDLTISQHFTVLTYSNGNNVIRLYCIDGTSDFSAYEESKNNINKIDYYNNASTDSFNFNPEGIENNQKNVSWNGSNVTFVITGNENISQEELIKIAVSVNIEPKE